MKVKLNNVKDNEELDKKNLFWQKTKPLKNTKSLALFLSCLFIIILIFLFLIFYLYDKKENFIAKILIRNLNDLNLKIEVDENCLFLNVETNKCSRCKPMYNLSDGLCEPNYSIKSIYITKIENEEVKLINELFLKYIKEITINNTKVSIEKESYTFPLPGNHIVYILIDISSLNSISYMFRQVNKMASISFTKKFESQNVKAMIDFFNNCNYFMFLIFVNL